jgi:hypothetical protein
VMSITTLLNSLSIPAMRMRSYRFLFALLGLPSLREVVIAQQSERITFELLGASKLTHEWGKDDSFCRGGGQKIVDLVGTFTLVLNQGVNTTGGAVEDVDIMSIDSQYMVTGCGFYSESRDPSSPTAEPPNISLMALTVIVNGDIKGIRLGVEPVGINRFIFPRLEAVLFQQSSAMRRDCFLMTIQARPIDADSEKFFRRGDTNGDGERNLTDVIVLLCHLFRGASEPLCADAADADDDGALNLTDAIIVLTYLFSGGALPPLPSTFCGIDITQDQLDCYGQPACESGNA